MSDREHEAPPGLGVNEERSRGWRAVWVLGGVVLAGVLLWLLLALTVL